MADLTIRFARSSFPSLCSVVPLLLPFDEAFALM